MQLDLLFWWLFETTIKSNTIIKLSFQQAISFEKQFLKIGCNELYFPKQLPSLDIC